MKKSVLLLMICLCIMVQAAAQKPGAKPAKGKATTDEDAIKKLIVQETDAYFNIDYKTWMKSWLHTPQAYWSFADTSGTTAFDGWRAIEIGFTDYFVTSQPNHTEVERQWQEIKVYGNGAYARFKQRVITNGVAGPEQVEIRVLERDPTDNNNWKILLVGVLKQSVSNDRAD